VAAPPASEPPKDIETPVVTENEAGAPVADTRPEAEGAQPRRRRGRRGGRRRRRHEDGTPIQGAASEQLEELDDEDREGDESVAPSQVAPGAAAAVTAAAVAAAAHGETGITPAIAASPSASELPETVTPAPAATAFNLPPLPPIPAATASDEPVTTTPSETLPQAPTVAAEAAVEPAPIMETSERPLAAAAPETAPEPVEPAKASEPTAEAQAPVSAEPELPAAAGTPVPMPKQGDLLTQATPGAAALPSDEAAEEPEPAPSDDEHPPKDAAQG
jgi:ribonuclease E